MRAQDQKEYPVNLVLLVNDAWQLAECHCYKDNGVSKCVTCSSVSILKALDNKGYLKRD